MTEVARQSIISVVYLCGENRKGFVCVRQAVRGPDDARLQLVRLIVSPQRARADAHGGEAYLLQLSNSAPVSGDAPRSLNLWSASNPARCVPPRAANFSQVAAHALKWGQPRSAHTCLRPAAGVPATLSSHQICAENSGKNGGSCLRRS